MKYHSTRGAAPVLDFRGVTMAGLASDGGLYLPQTWPQFSPADIAAMRGQSYQEIAFRVMQPFIGGAVAPAALRDIINRAYAGFDNPAITPLRQLGDQLYLLELFHGPTLAFKDVALQFLGLLFEHFTAQQSQRLTVIGATSGDTGSAAIAALADRANIDCVILYPHNRPSEIQRKQMTCVQSPNIHVLAVEGSFDDCQSIVKALFADEQMRARRNLAAVNSINWARILAQIVYYFVAVVQLGAPEKKVSFVVPTGNFGNVFAGHAARLCGLPIGQLGIASNSNDILTRFFASGEMRVERVSETISPSMDIQVSSNFERLLFELCGGQGADVAAKSIQLKSDGLFTISAGQLVKAKWLFASAKVNDEQTLATIGQYHEKTGFLLDPHSAVGVAAAAELALELPQPVVALGCAHAAKFPQTTQKAAGVTAPLPPDTERLLHNKERFTIVPPRIEAVAHYINERVQ